jgi:hypothetical protein
MFFLNISRYALVVASLSALAVSQVSDPNNLIQNGDFAGGATSWTVQGVHGAGCTGKVVDGAMVCEVAGNPGGEYDCQLLQQALTIVKGVTYIITYDIKAAAPRGQMQSAIELQVKPHTQFACGTDPNPKDNPQHDLTTTMQTFSREFTMMAETNTTLRLCFSFGGVLSTLTFDNISIIDKSKITAVRPRLAQSTEGTNALRVIADPTGLSFNVSDPTHFGFRIFSPSGRVVASSNSSNYVAAYHIDYRSLGISSGTYVAQAFDGTQQYSTIFSVIP